MGSKMLSRITFSVPIYCRSILNLYDGDGILMKKLADIHEEAGTRVYNLDASKMGEGNYRIRLETKNSDGRDVVLEEMLSIYWRR